MATIPRGGAPQLGPDARRLYRAIIDHVIAAGAAPSPGALARSTGPDAGSVSEAPAELIEREWAGRDAADRLTVTPEGVAKAAPDGVIVIRRRTPGPAHLTRCDATRFACSPAHGAAWLREHGGPHDLVAPLAEAFEEGRHLLGDAYRHGRCDCDCQGATAGSGGGPCAG